MSMTFRRLGVLVALAAAVAVGLLLLAVTTQPASAAFQGKSGKIAFVRGTKAALAGGEVWVMESDGTQQTRLTTTSVFDGLPAFSPNGERIAFTSRRESACPKINDEIYTMDPEDVDGDGQGDDLTRITFTATENEFQPAFSPSGERIAFTSNMDGSQNNEIYVMDADGTDRVQLTNNSPVRDARPAFSLRGDKIAFTSNRDGDDEIYVMNAADADGDGNGDNLTQITDNTTVVVNNARVPVTDEFPAFSPDGKELAFSSNRVNGGLDYDIYTMKAAPEDATANKPVRLDANTSDTISKPDWGAFYDFGGFYELVNNPPTINVVKAGAAVPVKFGLGGDQGLDIFAAGYPKSQAIPCNSETPIDSIEQTATAGDSGLSYDAATGRYAYVWKTSKAWSDTCREFVMKLDDHTVHTASFEFK